MCCMSLATDSTSIIADPIPWNYSSSRDETRQAANLVSHGAGRDGGIREGETQAVVRRDAPTYRHRACSCTEPRSATSRRAVRSSRRGDATPDEPGTAENLSCPAAHNHSRDPLGGRGTVPRRPRHRADGAPRQGEARQRSRLPKTSAEGTSRHAGVPRHGGRTHAGLGLDRSRRGSAEPLGRSGTGGIRPVRFPRSGLGTEPWMPRASAADHRRSVSHGDPSRRTREVLPPLIGCSTPSDRSAYPVNTPTERLRNSRTHPRAA